MLVFGRNPTLPTDLMDDAQKWEKLYAIDTDSKEETQQKLYLYMKIMNRAYQEITRENLRKQHHKANLKRVNKTPKIGDLVLVDFPLLRTQCKALHNRKIGPFVVTNIQNHKITIIAYGGKKEFDINLNRLILLKNDFDDYYDHWMSREQDLVRVRELEENLSILPDVAEEDKQEVEAGNTNQTQTTQQQTNSVNMVMEDQIGAGQTEETGLEMKDVEEPERTDYITADYRCDKETIERFKTRSEKPKHVFAPRSDEELAWPVVELPWYSSTEDGIASNGHEKKVREETGEGKKGEDLGDENKIMEEKIEGLDASSSDKEEVVLREGVSSATEESSLENKKKGRKKPACRTVKEQVMKRRETRNARRKKVHRIKKRVGHKKRSRIPLQRGIGKDIEVEKGEKKQVELGVDQKPLTLGLLQPESIGKTDLTEELVEDDIGTAETMNSLRVWEPGLRGTVLRKRKSESKEQEYLQGMKDTTNVGRQKRERKAYHKYGTDFDYTAQ